MPEANEGPNISPSRAAALIAESGAQLIDIRERYEWEAGRIAEARHIEMARITTEAESIDRDRPVIFQCRSGSRSAMVTAAFRQSGYDAYNLDGGLLAWVDEALPMEPEGGVVAGSMPDAS